MSLKHRLHLLFLPHEKNNHRAFLLQPSFLAILIAFYLLNQSILRSLATIKPGVLGYSSEITIAKVYQATNAERRAAGLPALKYSSTLTQSATAKADDMFAHNYWAHNSPQGKTPWDFFRSVGYQYSIAGENLAKDFYDTDSMMKAWMNSPTHKANILNAKYQEIGIGVVNGTLNGIETTLVVQHFGTPLVAPVATKDNSSKVEIPDIAAPIPEPEVLASAAPVINPTSVSKVLGAIMFSIILLLLIIDAVVTLKNKTHRVAGSNAGHISFLIIIFILLLFSQQGRIF
ncbi:CAP domain-containing protein [Patescibacteria group bacterium]|nr:CAP domain-containing protein [Patescibacteria group bacterium]